MNKFIKSIPYLLIIGLLIINMQILNRVENLEHNLHYANNEIRNVSSDVHSIRTLIREDLQEDDLIASFDYNILNKGKALTQVNVSVLLNEFEKDAKVYLAYKEADMSTFYSDVDITFDVQPSYETRRIELTQDAASAFVGSFEGNKQLSYDLTLVVENQDTIQSQALTSLDMFEKFYPDVDMDLSPGTFHSSGRIDSSYQLTIFNQQDINIVSANCRLTYKGEEYDAFDLLKETEVEYFGDEPLLIYDLDRSVTVEMASGAEPDFSDIKMEMVVKTDAGVTYTNIWSDY